MNDSPTLAINPETVGLIISRAREFHVQEQPVAPEEPVDSAEDWAMQTLVGHEDDMTSSELKSTIDDLEPDQQVQLVALMWLGRGDFSAAEWDSAVQEASDNWTSHAAEYLLGTPLVADYLQEGLTQLGYASEDFM